MLEWLRVWLIKPAMELLLLCPIPWRYGVLLLLPLILIYLLSPIGIIHRIAMWVALALVLIARSVAGSVQSLCANRPSSSLIDALDNATEWLLRRVARIEQSVRTRLGFSLDWGRPKPWLIILLALLPIGAWFVRPELGNITVGRGIDNGITNFRSLEGWAMTSQWKVIAESNPEIDPVATSTPSSAPRDATSPAIAATAAPPTSSSTASADPLKVGDRVRIIHTDNQGLRARDTPSRNGVVQAKFAEGSNVTIIDGPKKADGYVWWKVQGASGEGWCAADFLARGP